MSNLVIICWNFTIFQHMSDLLQVKQNLISSIANLVYELPHKLSNDLRRIRKTQKNLNSTHSLIPSLPLRKQPFAITKEIRKTDTKLFFSCLVLLYISILFKIFCPGLSEQVNLWFLFGSFPFQLHFSTFSKTSKHFFDLQ